MKRPIQLLISLVFALNVTVLVSTPTYAASSLHKLCNTKVSAHTVRCFAQAKSKGSVPLATQSLLGGLTPADFRVAYRVGQGATHIAIVAAYDAPNALSDLGVYSSRFGLPVLPSCANGAQTGCFAKLDQNGGTSYPRADANWALEASMDTQAAHATCPKCRITLVEAKSTGYDDLAAAVDRAVAVGAKIVSNSYGGPESSLQKSYDSHYKRPGVVMTASSGDNGYDTNWPAASPDVIAVGGTSLQLSNGKVTSETAWQGAGSGCSKYESKPAWQKDSGCSSRSIADVSAVADPNTGAAVYDSYAISHQSGWFVVGGTSLAAPLVAGLLGSKGQTSNQPSGLYANLSLIRDITSGSNGSCKTYLCNATKGYDGPTGLGVLKF
jgi:subtilase family serine protease